MELPLPYRQSVLGFHCSSNNGLNQDEFQKNLFHFFPFGSMEFTKIRINYLKN